LAGSEDEVVVHDMHKPEIASLAAQHGVRSLPAVMIDGKLADCCSGRGSKSTSCVKPCVNRRISSGTLALAIAELKLCRSEWNERRETFRPGFPSFSRATPSSMPALCISLLNDILSPDLPAPDLLKSLGKAYAVHQVLGYFFQHIFLWNPSLSRQVHVCFNPRF
jgi:hypothetical protein